MLRLIISPTRSVSTALLRCFENNPAVARVFHQPVKSGFREGKAFDYSIYSLDTSHAAKIIVAKETIGGFELVETGFSPLPAAPDVLHLGVWALSHELVLRVEPLVLLREPLQTWASIERLNQYAAGRSPYHSPLQFFLASYANVVAFAVAARRRGLPVYVLTAEQLGRNPENCLRRVCEKWEIPWTRAMIDWPVPYGIKTWFSAEAAYRMTHDPRFIRSKESLAAANRFAYSESTVDAIVTPEARAVITQRLEVLYRRAKRLAHHDFG
jgi:hypothetical protein